jgi:hypothetical protein
LFLRFENNYCDLLVQWIISFNNGWINYILADGFIRIKIKIKDALNCVSLQWVHSLISSTSAYNYNNNNKLN